MENIVLNPRMSDVKCSATLAINEKIHALRREGKTVVHFGFGESPFDVAKPIQDALTSASLKTQYLPGEGLHTLRQAISNHYKSQFNYAFDEADVFVAPGSKEAIFHLLYLIDGPLLLPAPSWGKL